MNINAFNGYALQSVFYLRSWGGRKLAFIKSCLCASNCTYLSQYRNHFFSILTTLFFCLKSFKFQNHVDKPEIIRKDRESQPVHLSEIMKENEGWVPSN